MKKFLVLAVLALAASFFSLALGQTQVKADQGRPGNQGPWPVTATFTQGDGGTNAGLVTQQAPCVAPVESIIQFDGGVATTCPLSQAPGRRFVIFCNSDRNATNIWTIRADWDGGLPTTALNSPGQTLSVGKCIQYTINTAATPPRCISDVANAVLNITECQ